MLPLSVTLPQALAGQLQYLANVSYTVGQLRKAGRCYSRRSWNLAMVPGASSRRLLFVVAGLQNGFRTPDHDRP